MTQPAIRIAGRYTIYYYSATPDPKYFLNALFQSKVISHKGRAGIRVFQEGDLQLVARKYTHGGLFRVFTGDLFLGAERALAEAHVLAHLHHERFPAVTIFAVVVEKRIFLTRLYLVTVFEENKGTLLEVLHEANAKQRMRFAVKLAHLLWRMEQARVCHPDFHLRNVLVTPGNDLVCIDFDRAAIRKITEDDMLFICRRLERFTAKMERQRQLHADLYSKVLFLRIYDRLSGWDLTTKMASGFKRRSLFHRIGWFIEALLYGRN